MYARGSFLVSEVDAAQENAKNGHFGPIFDTYDIRTSLWVSGTSIFRNFIENCVCVATSRSNWN